MYKDMIEKEFLNIKLVGRLAEYRYMNMDECIKRDMEVVENV
jgi:UDP-galactopyranose mutase